MYMYIYIYIYTLVISKVKDMERLPCLICSAKFTFTFIKAKRSICF